MVFVKDKTIIFNRSKSKYMWFKPKLLSNLLIPDIYLNWEVLTTAGKTKYLGVFIDCDALDSDDIMDQFKAIYAGAMFWLADLWFAMMMLSLFIFNPM